MDKYRIYRHPEGISLNGKEFICDDNGEVRLFNSERLALFWLQKESGHTIEAKHPEELWDNYAIGIEKDHPNQYFDEEIN